MKKELNNAAMALTPFRGDQGYLHIHPSWREEDKATASPADIIKVQDIKRNLGGKGIGFLGSADPKDFVSELYIFTPSKLTEPTGIFVIYGGTK